MSRRTARHLDESEFSENGGVSKRPKTSHEPSDADVPTTSMDSASLSRPHSTTGSMRAESLVFFAPGPPSLAAPRGPLPPVYLKDVLPLPDPLGKLPSLRILLNAVCLDYLVH